MWKKPEVIQSKGLISKTIKLCYRILLKDDVRRTKD